MKKNHFVKFWRNKDYVCVDSLFYCLLKWFQDVLNRICVKVAAKLRQKEYFFSLCQCKLYDVTEAPILVRFRWKYIYLVERVSTVIFVPNLCTFIAYLQSTEEKEVLPSKIDQNQYFFLFSPVRNTKTLIVRKIIFMPKWPQYSFLRLAGTTRSKNFGFLKKIGKTTRGGGPPLRLLRVKIKE